MVEIRDGSGSDLIPQSASPQPQRVEVVDGSGSDVIPQSASPQPQRVEVVDGSGSDVIPQSASPQPQKVEVVDGSGSDVIPQPASPQLQMVEVVDGSGSDLIPQSPPPKKIQQLRCGVIFWVLMVPYTAFVSQYVYQVLRADHPHVGRLFRSPADTNLIITILSQVFCLLIQALFKNIFDVLRWQLASRERGVPIPTFLQLSGATKWLGVLTLIAIKGNHHIWGLQR
jgi:uncharacterized protein YnzC (UPF0291/DUF896 family)